MKAHPMVSVTISSPNLAVGEQWQDLVSRAAPNVFMDPAALTAAGVTDFADIRMLLAWDEGPEPRKLVGLWALRIREIAPFWPATLAALPYNYAFLSTPVVDADFIDRVIPAFVDAIADHPDLPKVMNLPSFNADSPVCDVLARVLAARGGAQLIVAETQRPFVTREFGVKRSGSTRKKLRQDWKRLS